MDCAYENICFEFHSHDSCFFGAKFQIVEMVSLEFVNNKFLFFKKLPKEIVNDMDFSLYPMVLFPLCKYLMHFLLFITSLIQSNLHSSQCNEILSKE